MASGGKGRKIGRNKVKGQNYRAAGTREENKKRRAEKRAHTLRKRKVKRELDAQIDAMVQEVETSAA